MEVLFLSFLRELLKEIRPPVEVLKDLSNSHGRHHSNDVRQAVLLLPERQHLPVTRSHGEGRHRPAQRSDGTAQLRSLHLFHPDFTKTNQQVLYIGCNRSNLKDTESEFEFLTFLFWVFHTDSYLPDRGGSSRAPNETNNSSAAIRASVDGGVGKGKLITCENRHYKMFLVNIFNSYSLRLFDLLLLTFSILRSFICKIRSSTGLRVISASENRLKSPNTAEEYNLWVKFKKNYREWWKQTLPCGVTRPRELWPVAVPRFCTTGSTRPLIGRGLGGPRDFEGRHSGHFIVETLLHPAAVHHVFDAGDSQGCFCYVCGHDTETSPRWRRPEHLQTPNIPQCVQRLRH